MVPVLFWAGLATLAYLLFLVVQPFLTPLAWAAVIAIVFHPSYARLERRWGPTRAAAFGTAAVTVIVIVPILLVTAAFAREALAAIADLQAGLADGRFAWIERAWNAVVQRVPGYQRFDMAALAADAARRAALFLATTVGAVARNTAGFLFDLVIALFATFFLLRDSAAIVEVIRRLLPVDASMRERWIAQTRQLVSVSITSSGIVAAVQGLLGGIVFAAVGIDAPVFWGGIIAFVCLLPLGAWIVWLPAAVVLAAGGAVGRALIVAALGFGIVSGVDNILRPILLSGRTRMNGLLVLVSLLGGVAAFGAAGLVLGPLVMATAVALVQSYSDGRPAPPSPPHAQA